MRNDSFNLLEKMPGLPGLLLAAVVLAVLTAGCEQPVSIRPNLKVLNQAPPYGYTDQDWAQVLHDYVHDGLVDYAGLAAHHELLDRYYALLGVTGPARTPDQFPSAAHATAYWINAYNAAVILFVLQHFPAETIYDESVPKIELASFRIDGQARTLPQIESKILEASGGDVRALFATSRGSVGTPRLPAEPMRPATLERQLADAAADALNNPRLLKVDHAGRQILLWQLVLTRKDDFLKYYCTRRRTSNAHLLGVLMDLASAERRRSLQSAVGYVFHPMPFGRPLNNWSSGPPGLRGTVGGVAPPLAP